MIEQSQTVAEPSKGFAFFDGLFFRTDSFSDPNVERVMPILEEEQVLMCRLMRDTLSRLQERISQDESRGLRILDVGSGSGVLGIHAARYLAANHEAPTSQVTALDVNPRAVLFTEKNAELNGLTSPGQFTVRKPQKYQSESSAQNHQDIILINPPYHPSPDGDLWHYRVACHAEAGNDCLKLFKEWLPLIAEHLRRPGGMLIGSMLSPAKARTPDDIEVFRLSREQFGACKITYCYHLVDPFLNMQAFLRGVYADYLEHIDGERLRHLNDWIDCISNEFPWITVVYFEIERLEDKMPVSASQPDAEVFSCHSASITNTNRVSAENPHHTTRWNHRVRLHRLIANSIERIPGEIATERLLGQFTPPFPSKPDFERIDRFFISQPRAQDSESRQSLKDIRCCTSLSDVWRYIRDAGLMNLFDLICVDPTPMFASSSATPTEIAVETAAWISERLGDSKSVKQIPDDFLRCNQSVMSKAHATLQTPFYHPVLVSDSFELGWPRGFVSCIQEDRVLAPHWVAPQCDEDLARYRRALEECEEVRKRNGNEAFRTPYSLYDTPPYGAFVATPLSTLREHQSRYMRWTPHIDAMKKRTELLKDHPGYCPSKKVFDLILCHLAVHELLHCRVQTSFSGFSSHPLMSYYICIPLRLLILEGDSRVAKEEDLPAHYAGAFWIWAGVSARCQNSASRSPSGPPYQETLYDLARFVSNLLMRSTVPCLREESSVRMGLLSHHSMVTAALGHEQTVVVSGFDKDPPTNPEQLRWWADQSRVAMNYINLSTGGKDARYPDWNEGTDKGLVAVYKWAWRSMLLWICADGLEEVAADQSLRVIYEEQIDRDLSPLVDCENDFTVSDQPETSKWLFLLLLAALRNAIKHTYKFPVLRSPQSLKTIKELQDSGMPRVTVSKEDADSVVSIRTFGTRMKFMHAVKAHTSVQTGDSDKTFQTYEVLRLYGENLVESLGQSFQWSKFCTLTFVADKADTTLGWIEVQLRFRLEPHRP